MKKIRRISPHDQSGFTIVELMISTLVFSMILMLITYGVMHFSTSYYRGLNRSTTQNTARSVIDTVSQAIQFSADTQQSASGTTGHVCAGNQEFMYNIGKQVPLASGEALYQFTVPEGNCYTTAQVSGGDPTATAAYAKGRELLSSHMRLAAFSVQPLPTDSTMWQIGIKVAYGDDDLFCSSNKAGSCTSPTALTATDLTTPATLKGLNCKSQTGSQFCAISELSTTVKMRINAAP